VGDSLHDGEIAQLGQDSLRGSGRDFRQRALHPALPGAAVDWPLAEILDLLPASRALAAARFAVQVVLLAAGLGSRLGALTKDIPRP